MQEIGTRKEAGRNWAGLFLSDFTLPYRYSLVIGNIRKHLTVHVHFAEFSVKAELHEYYAFAIGEKHLLNHPV